MRKFAVLWLAVFVLTLLSMSLSSVWSQSPQGERSAVRGGQGRPVPSLPPGGFQEPEMPPGPGLPPLIQSLDQDGDGEISGEEIKNAPAALKGLDENGDHHLSTEELGVLINEFPGRPGRGGFGPGGPMGVGGPGGFGGPGGPMGQQRKVVRQFDRNGDGWLNGEERLAARRSLGTGEEIGRRGGRGFGPPGGPGGRGMRQAAQPGPRVSPEDVVPSNDAPLYDPSVLRTLFIQFDNEDWESELKEFKSTDVDVPATLLVDGKTYPNVGIRFRGNSSYAMVPDGYKRSLNVSLDLADANQRLYGHKTLNLLNCAGDPSLLSSALYSHIARQYIPAPQANFVKVVINGESWGIYANVQQINKEFLAENFGSSQGARWKALGSPGADAGLRYLGDNIDDYRRRFEIKSKDDDKSWHKLIELCRTLDETPVDQLEDTISPMLDIERVLWFLAIDVALVNSDGYWTRASDFSLFCDQNNVFHVMPYDMNEAFHGSGGFGPPGGPGGGFGPGGPGGGFGPGGPGGGFEGGRRRGPGGGGFGGGGTQLDPLVALDDPGKPLRSRLLAVPALREEYLKNLQTLAESTLDWSKLAPVIAQYRALLESEVAADTRKLSSAEAFLNATDSEAGSLKAFLQQRRDYLLNAVDRELGTVRASPGADPPGQ